MERISPALDEEAARTAGVHRRNRDDDEDDPAARPVAPGATAADDRAVRSLGNANLHRRAASRWAYRALGDRRPDEPASLRDLCRNPARSDAAARRHGHS